MPGGGSITAANHIYTAAKPDGLTFGTFNNALVLAQLTKVEGVRFDLNKFAWLGSLASDATVLTIRSDLPYKTVEELRKAKEPVIFGATGVADTSYVFPFFLKEFAGLNFKMVTGYAGSAPIMLAVERKEVDGRAGSYASLKPSIDRGLVRPLIRSRVSSPEIKGLPVDEDLATTPKGRSLMAIRTAPTLIYRPYVAPPGTSGDALKILRDAFARASADKEFLAEASKGKLPIDYAPAEECLKIIQEVLGQPPETVQEISKYMKFGD
jgi:tripartite-type tricarboxylate transporter receptor subunit TctC